MNPRQLILKLLPTSIRNSLTIRSGISALKKLPKSSCSEKSLLPVAEVNIKNIVTSASSASAWEHIEKEIEEFNIPDGTGGVNLGDRRALFNLIYHFRPISVLEIGTHIGASTLHIVSALNVLKMSGAIDQSTVTSVDISDVNDIQTKPWLKFGSKQSPQELINSVGYEGQVDFLTDMSVSFLASADSKFDFIFLDGDHSAKTVYQEIPLALNLLNEGGVILLHDYFPDLQPLWKNGLVIPGPYLAIQRLRDEGLDVEVLPLGDLPWPTKFGSCKTSLALLLKSA